MRPLRVLGKPRDERFGARLGRARMKWDGRHAADLPAKAERRLALAQQLDIDARQQQ